jgi:hypothetical protein
LRRTWDDEGAIFSLQPSEPTRQAMQRLRRLVAARAAIRHPNLLRLRVIGEEEGRLFVAFALSGHGTLSELLSAGPLEPAESALLLEGAAAGVDALSARGLVAYDLRPDRVLVDPARGPVLMNLGIPPKLLRPSRLEEAEDLSFRSPEDLAGEPVDDRSSVYSLGAMLSVALTGVPASREHRYSSPHMDAVVARATAVDPMQRYSDAKTLARAVTAAAELAAGTARKGHSRRPPSERTAENALPSEARSERRSGGEPRTGRLHRMRLVLPAAAAIVASALCGIVLGRAMDPDTTGPSSVTRSGLTVQLPPGWERAQVNPGRLRLSSGIAAAPSGATSGGFVVGTVSSQAAAERLLERSQSGGRKPVEVRLGGAYAWRYAGLRARPDLVGVGYLVPTASGAVVMLCHAAEAAAGAAPRLAECGRAATTLVIRGARPHRVLVDRFAKDLAGVVATLRASRSAGLRRLAAADRAFGQARAAASLERSHERAARSIKRISDGTGSVSGLTAALRSAADAYGRLGRAAKTRSRSAYRDARRAVVREETAVRRELPRAGAG